MSSSSSSRPTAGRRPSTAVLQQFASSGSHRERGSSPHHPHGGQVSPSPAASTPPHYHKPTPATTSYNDNTSATTAESTSWSSSRSTGPYGVFPRSHPHHSARRSTPPQTAQGGAGVGGRYHRSASPSSYQERQASSYVGATAGTTASPSFSSGNSPYRSNTHHPYPPMTAAQQAPKQQHRHMYRDDYSRSQHSEDEWTEDAATGSGGGVHTPPRPAASDPGAQNRFAAYVNRFATVDPRMDYSDSVVPSPTHSPYRPSAEEKKDDFRRHGQQYDMDNNADLFSYPDPEFGLEQMKAAERDVQRGPPSMAGSAATTTVLHTASPSRRTKDLARRFEERTQLQPAAIPPWHQKAAARHERAASQPPPTHRGRGAYYPDKASSSARWYPRQSSSPHEGGSYGRTAPQRHDPTPSSHAFHQLQPSNAAHDPPGTPPRPSPTNVQGRYAVAAVPASSDYRARSEIETPSPARVSALKQKLWDESESLNVKVRPSPQSRPKGSFRQARSLSPKTSRRVFQHFGRSNNETTEENMATGTTAFPPVTTVPGHPTATSSAHPTHFEWTESSSHVNGQGQDDRHDHHRRLLAYHKENHLRSNRATREESSLGREERSHNSSSQYHRDRGYQNREEQSQYSSTTPMEDFSSLHGHRSVEERPISAAAGVAHKDDRSQQSGSRDDRLVGAHKHEDERVSRQRFPQVPPHEYENGGELQNSPFFKSRFFEAAEKSVDRPTPSLSHANSSTSSAEKGTAPAIVGTQSGDSGNRFFQRQLEVTEELISHESNSQQHRHSTASMGSGSRHVGTIRATPPGPPGSAVGATSYASTPLVSNHQENVAHLLAKLQSVNRADPKAALKEIDAILKAESGGSTAEMPVPPPAEEPLAAPLHGTEEDDEADSDSETTVSSITNPTFSGQGKHRKKKEEARKAHQQTLPTTAEGEVADYDVKQQPKEPAGHHAESRRRKTRSPPPNTIQVSGSRDRGSDRGGVSKRSMSPVTRGVDVEGRIVNAAEKMFPSTLDPTAELAEKIRRWDELSGKGSAPEVKTPEMMSDTTDALGSIVTPSDMLPKMKPHHPWDSSLGTRRGKVEMRDTSMDNGAGVEMQFSPTSRARQRQKQWRRHDERNNPFASDSDHESQQGSRAGQGQEGSLHGSVRHTQTVVNMSNDFDDAWVSMPTSNFFTATTPPRRAIGDKDSEGSPPAPPVSAKRASVQKFSPKRFESTQREITYEPPSLRDRSSGQMENMGAYDEKRVEGIEPIPASREDNVEDNVEVTLVGGKKEKRKGLRALLQRRNVKSQSLGASSVISSSSRRRGQPHMAAYEKEMDPPRSSSRGRRRGVSPSHARSRSLEERHIRNPNIAKKFSRLLRVYNDEDRRPAEV